MHLTELLSELITGFISSTGYLTVFIGMIMESMVIPLPSETILPFAGFLVVEGRFNYMAVVLIATFGSLIGSSLSYIAGYYLGKPFVSKFGKYLLLDEEELETTEKYFRKHGEITVFICRFIPVVRHLISIPAGTGKMKFAKFIAFTASGALLWNGLLTYIGCVLKQHWDLVMKYSRVLDYLVLMILFALLALFILRHYKKSKKTIQ